ncbi:hypothetical protein Scep_024646 [Stephania cephalantha]|uniref:Uncharacterized protein n=1 Tax=Stephania cephalantha TaxID=152367 RepID=A0AAP0EY83_9MAGN
METTLLSMYIDEIDGFSAMSYREFITYLVTSTPRAFGIHVQQLHRNSSSTSARTYWHNVGYDSPIISDKFRALVTDTLENIGSTDILGQATPRIQRLFRLVATDNSKEGGREQEEEGKERRRRRRNAPGRRRGGGDVNDRGDQHQIVTIVEAFHEDATSDDLIWQSQQIPQQERRTIADIKRYMIFEWLSQSTTQQPLHEDMQHINPKSKNSKTQVTTILEHLMDEKELSPHPTSDPDETVNVATLKSVKFDEFSIVDEYFSEPEETLEIHGLGKTAREVRLRLFMDLKSKEEIRRFENAFWSVGRPDRLGISVWIERCAVHGDMSLPGFRHSPVHLRGTRDTRSMIIEELKWLDDLVADGEFKTQNLCPYPSTASLAASLNHQSPPPSLNYQSSPSPLFDRSTTSFHFPPSPPPSTASLAASSTTSTSRRIPQPLAGKS